MLSQAEFFRQFNNDTKIEFNDALFDRDQDEIMIELMKVILSAQREQIFTIKVLSFVINDDPDKIDKILADYVNYTERNIKKKKPNEYEYVNLRDSDVRLLTVHYLIKDKNDSEILKVHILLPRVVDKYYFRIGGNMWLAMLQIVDGSTYNNSLSNNPRKASVTCKTVMPSRIFKNFGTLEDMSGENIECVYFTSNIFKKTLPLFKYILAKYGYFDGKRFVEISDIELTSAPSTNKEDYCVKLKDGIYISVPRYLFDNDQVVQSFFYTMAMSIMNDKRATMEKVITRDYWLEVLGAEFKTATVKKGLELLNSLEGIYDISTKEDLRLDDYTKRNIYSILLWIVREFARLKVKDNLDVRLKYVRYGKYIASLYSMKLIKGLKRLTDSKNKVEIKSIVRAIKTKPTFLLDEICKCNLINYRNLVNDQDALLALKYSFKGVSGIGDNNNKSIPDIYRHAHYSHLGILDTDSSPKSDPGISGVLCPMIKLHDNYFTDYKEPDYWEEEFKRTLDEYKQMTSRKEVIKFKQELGLKVDSEELTIIEKNIEISKGLIDVIKFNYEDERLAKFKPIIDMGGMIYFE